MAKDIQPALSAIQVFLKLKSDVEFYIPKYQRKYSWGKDQCDKLWQNLLDFANNSNEKNYFFGTIIINCESDDKKLVLIDGQQRTITFLLLLKALLIKINEILINFIDDDDSVDLKEGLKRRRAKIMSILYRVDEDNVKAIPKEKDDKELFKNTLLVNDSINKGDYWVDFKNIINSYNINEIERNVKKIPGKKNDNKYSEFFRNFKFFYYDKILDLRESDLNNITKKLLEECQVIEIKSWDEDQAIKMFNSLNSDGLPLSDSDIISSKLYEAAGKQNNSEIFEKLWKDILKETDELKNQNICDLDSILMQYMYYIRANEGDTITERESINVTTPGLRRYYTTINKGLIEQPIDFCNNLDNLCKAWFNVITKPITQVLLKFNENAKLFLASFLLKNDKTKISDLDIELILKCMLRLFTILELVDKGYSSSEFKTFLFEEQYKFVKLNESINDIKKDFDKHIKQKWTKEEIEEQIIDYNKNAIVYLNEYLYSKEIDKELDLTIKHDIEHIMPSSGRNIDAIREYAGISDKEEFKSVANKIGNKILLEYQINRSIGDEWFKQKISNTIVKKQGYKNSSFPFAQHLVEKFSNVKQPKWGRSEIDIYTSKASERIIKFLFEG